MKSTVLLIDDDPLDMEAMRLLLESWDIDVVTSRSGADAMALLDRTPVDLLVSDVCMPGMTGQDVVRVVRESHPGLPVVLITGHADIKTAVEAMKMGASDYVVKPPDPDEFKLTLERAMEHSRLRRENEFLRAELAAGGMYGERLIAQSPAMLRVFEMINRVAKTDTTVLITGETGTGKELIAQTVHYRSARADRPLVALNCAAINPNLIESELFGHEKGAFTGAVTARRGRFEDADGGTLFLDEIAETGIEFQAKLLRVLQEGEFEKVGGNRKMHVDVRVLASTNRDLKREIQAEKFREDLFYRISVIPIHLPALRDRPEDIPLLASHFVKRYGETYDCPAKTISDAGLAHLASLEWPGNVRELQHVIERAVVLSRGDILDVNDFTLDGESSAAGGNQDETLQAVLDLRTREHLLTVLDRSGWRKGRAADKLGIDRATLYRMLKKYSIEGRGSARN